MKKNLPELVEIAQICGWLAQWGWSEASGGNISIRLDDVPPEVINLPGGDSQPLPLTLPELAGRYFLVSGGGTRARDIAIDVEAGIGLYCVLPGGTEYRWLWGNNRPTIELPSHMAIHAALVKDRPAHHAIIHTHPPNLIALSHLPELQTPGALSDMLLRVQSEARLILPEGIGFLPHHLPGSLELGLASAEAIRKHFVVLWQLHGALASGETLSKAADYLEVVNKAAQIFWTLANAGRKPNGMTDEDIRVMLNHFGRWERYEFEGEL